MSDNRITALPMPWVPFYLRIGTCNEAKVSDSEGVTLTSW